MIIGVDGCRGGWLACLIDNDERLSIQLFGSFAALMEGISDFQDLWIDIPIGLSSRGVKRDVDKMARAILPRSYKSSIFTPPCREAVYAADYPQACVLNREITGVGISKQTWNIVPKIKEIDLYLLNHQDFTIREVHPELCLYYLNHHQCPKDKKKTASGQSTRLSILSRYYQSIEEAFNLARETYRRSDVQNDDIIDAMIIAVSAKASTLYGESRFLGSAHVDAHGIPIGLSYCEL